MLSVRRAAGWLLTLALAGCSDAKSGAKEGAESTSWMVYAIIGFVVVQIVVLGYIQIRSYRRKKADDAPGLRCRCPSCKKKIGYPASKVGSEIRCSGCRKPFKLPAGTPEAL